MMYYFQPTGQAYSKEQIQGFVGIDPETTPDEILNFYKIFRIVPLQNEPDVFLVPEPKYEIYGSFAYQVPSTQAIPLNEAQKKAKQIVIEEANQNVRVIAENFGFSSKLFCAVLSQDLSSFDCLGEEVAGLVQDLQDRLRAIDQVTNEQQLREICFKG